MVLSFAIPFQTSLQLVYLLTASSVVCLRNRIRRKGYYVLFNNGEELLYTMNILWIHAIF